MKFLLYALLNVLINHLKHIFMYSTTSRSRRFMAAGNKSLNIVILRSKPVLVSPHEVKSNSYRFRGNFLRDF